jgi:hypothetical protein
MKSTRLLPAFALLALTALPSCGTVHTARWTYGMPSCFDETTSESESVGLRAIVGAPLILGGVMFDAVTWPGQLIFGVWPMWGPSSLHMKPENIK